VHGGARVEHHQAALLGKIAGEAEGGDGKAAALGLGAGVLPPRLRREHAEWDAREGAHAGRSPVHGPQEGERRPAGRVRRGEELHRRLAEAGDLRAQRLALGRVGDALEVDGALVGEVEEDVVRLLRRLPLLLSAKDEVDPQVQVAAHVLRLEGAPVLRDEVVRAARPHRQHHVAHPLVVLPHAELEAAVVAQKVGQVEELGDELLDVGEGGGARVPRLLERREEPVRVVEAPRLQLDRVRGVRLEPEQPEEHRTRRRVVRAVVEARHVRLGLHLLVPLDDLR